MATKELMPHEVFEPGKAEPTDMYVSRPKIEKELSETPSSDRPSLLIGGSGSGKSWLYRKFFQEVNAAFSVLTVTRDHLAPFRQLIENELSRLGVSRLSRERTFGGINQGLMAGKEQVREFDGFDALLSLAAKLRRIAGRQRPAYLVVENAEQGLSDKTGKFIPELITLIMASDQQLAVQRVRLLIVGADDSILTALANMPNHEPHTRRIRRLPEVTSFSEGEAKQFMDRGFRQMLDVRIADMDELLKACEDATDLRPDFLSEYCLLLAKGARNRLRRVDDYVIAEANEEWAKTRMSPYIERIAASMNTRDTRKRVRDKMLYALAKRATRGYTRQNIQDILKDDFPTENFQTNEITSALHALCASDGQHEPLFRKFGSDNSPLFGFSGATERIATAFALGRRGDRVFRHDQ